MDGDQYEGPFYVTKPFRQEPDWAVTRINLDLDQLAGKGYRREGIAMTRRGCPTKKRLHKGGVGPVMRSPAGLTSQIVVTMPTRVKGRTGLCEIGGPA